jgi:hypothetical protein
LKDAISPYYTNGFSAAISGSENDGGWGIFNSLFGWQNSALYGTVNLHNISWISVNIGFALMAYRERTGRGLFASKPEEIAAEAKPVLPARLKAPTRRSKRLRCLRRSDKLENRGQRCAQRSEDIDWG